MRRRDFLGAFSLLGLGKCDRRWLMATGLPAHNPPIDGSALTMSPNPLSGALIYEMGNFAVTLSRPRVAFESSGLAHFTGLLKFPTGEILLRVNTTVDAAVVGTGVHRLSLDNGATFDTTTDYAVVGSHTNSEPIYMGADGAARGGTFRDFVSPYLGDATKAACSYQVIDQGGRRTTFTANGCVISGLTGAINVDTYGIYTNSITWNSDIVRISDSQWLSLIQVTYQPPPDVTYFLLSHCIESADQGQTWTVVGTVNPLGGTAEETTMVRLTDGRLLTIIRLGPDYGACSRSLSSDLGRTWTTPTKIRPWAKAPRLQHLATADDYAVVTGLSPYSTIDPPGFYPPPLSLSVSSTPDTGYLIGGPEFDLIAHHQATVDPEYQFVIGHTGNDVPNTTGYTGTITPIPSQTNRMLISYDQNGAPYGKPNRVYVVDAIINRIA